MVTLTANSVQTLKSVIVSSDLITMLPRISIRNEEKNKILRPIPLRAPDGGGSSPFFAAPIAPASCRQSCDDRISQDAD